MIPTKKAKKINNMKKQSDEKRKTEVLEIVENVNLPAVFDTDGREQAKQIIDQVRETAFSYVADASTEKGRKEIRSVAYSVARCKTLLDETGKEMVADMKDKIKNVDGVRKLIRDELDHVKGDVMKPVAEWEAKIKAVEERIEAFRSLSDVRMGESAETIALRLDRLEYLAGEKLDAMGQEEELAKEEKYAADILTKAKEEREKHEAEQAELERLRKEKAERDAEEAKRKAEEERKARDEKIRHETQERMRAKAEENARIIEERAKQAEQKSANKTAPTAPKGTESQVVDPCNQTIRTHIEDALMNEIAWMMPDKAADIAEAICSGVLPGVEVKK